MRTQSDTRERVVSLDNLKAMCERLSGVCHVYSVTVVSRSRVHVEYTNPDEYGSDYPMTAVFPCFPGEEPDNPRVLLSILRVLRDSWDGEGWQAFDPLVNCPTLWRDPDGRWHSHSEIRTCPAVSHVTPCNVCTVCDRKDDE